MNAHNPFAIGAEFIHDLYRRYTEDPVSVDSSWSAFFDGVDVADVVHLNRRAVPAKGIDAHRTAVMLGRLIENYRWRGHLRANLDPLGLAKPPGDRELALDCLGLSIGDPQVAPALNGELGLAGAPLRVILERLEQIYCGTTGFEYMNVTNPAAREWLRNAIETGWGFPDAAMRRSAVERLIEADELEQFMQRRYTGKKRFGIEGAESVISWFWAVLDRGARLGAKTVVVGGTARGRLNQMANIVGKPLEAIFAEFYGARPFPEDVRASGDVAYHLGFAGEQQFGDVRLRIDYCNNPSHLEAVDAVTLGRVRALQARYHDAERARAEVLGLMVHTDAAFAGQGVVAEVLQLSGLEHYTIGGAIHVIINNQVGFTTDPQSGRTSIYCSDAAKTIRAPVLHVNGDDVDAVLRAAALAAEFRHRFHSDVIVDLVCYRRRGHNEVDEPTFTQPAIYRKVAEHPSTRQIYVNALRQAGSFTPGEEEAIVTAYRARLENGYENAQAYRPRKPSVVARGSDAVERQPAAEGTGVALSRLREIGSAMSSVPAGLDAHPKVQRILQERVKALEAGSGIDWALAEALAYGSLLAEGVGVRLSGQDTPRGAFSHRHFVLHDRSSGRSVPVFDAVTQPRAGCEIIHSPLAEYATLGFEYGFSLDAPDHLVVWEAQFGDFANVAQVVIDQFVSTGEDKWLQPSNLVLLLPHGLEGQGPEHSSARIERFLQMCAAGNMTIANCTTPANYFHLLRRQAYGPRRPLVVFTPKSLLRHRSAVSTLAEMAAGTHFQPVFGPSDAASHDFRRIVLCSGKIYWELLAERERLGLVDVGIVRLEQLYPFPDRALEGVLRSHSAAQIVWCQEEPKNMGPWTYVDRRVESVIRGVDSAAPWPSYIGRPENPSPAIGTYAEHTTAQACIVREALCVDGAVLGNSAISMDHSLNRRSMV